MRRKRPGCATSFRPLSNYCSSLVIYYFGDAPKALTYICDTHHIGLLGSSSRASAPSCRRRSLLLHLQEATEAKALLDDPTLEAELPTHY